MPTFDQIRAPLERVLLVALTYAVAKGWIAKELVGDILALVLAVGGFAWGIYTTRPSVVAARAAEILPEGSTIVTSPEIAKATPGNANIVSSSTMEVVEK